MKRAALIFLLLSAPGFGQLTVTVTQQAASTNAAPANPANAAPAKQNAPGGPAVRTQPGGAIQFKRPARIQNVIFGGGGIRNTFGRGPDAVPHSISVPTLYWKNGENLGGDIAGGGPGEITWKTELFQDPLELKSDVIDRIEWPGATTQPASAFSVTLRDGSFIYADLVSVGADTVTIRSPHHGDVALKRSEILSIRRLQGGDILFAGPTGDVGWQSLIAQGTGGLVHSPFGGESDSALSTGPGGALKMNVWNRCALLDLQLPQSIDVEFHLHSSEQPAFSVALGGNLTEPLRIETWDGELVLVLRTRFKAIRKLAPTDRDIALRVCWDGEAKKCFVFNMSGELLTEWDAEGDVAHDSGLVVANKGKDLTLDFLQVRAWHNKPPPKGSSAVPRVELSDGHTAAGAIVSGASGSITVEGASGPAQYPVDKIDALYFSSDAPQAASRGAVLVYADGETVQGDIASLSPGAASMTTSFTAAPLSCKLANQRRLIIHSAAPKEITPLDQLDRIVIQSTTLHGTFDTAGGNTLAWLPVGGVKPSRPAAALSAEIDRALPPDTPLPADPALFYMASGDIVPGTLHSLDRNGAEFDSSLVETKRLPASDLNAIQFGAGKRINVHGFNDPGWHIIKGDTTTAHFDGDKVNLEPGAEIGYPSLMEASEIRFKYASSGFSSLRLRLFGSSSDDPHAMNILLGNTGAQFICGQESNVGQFSSQAQLRTTPGQPVSVRLVIHDDEVEIFANDVSLQELPLDPQALSGSGFIMEPAGLWGNGAFPVALSEFLATSGFGRTWLPDVDSDAKIQALTVPRFEKEDPPKHVLVATNGDLLRGEVEAATDTHFAFRTGLETLSVPRDRVKALIWLKPPDANAPAPAQQPAGPNPLAFRLQGRVMFGEVNLANLIGFMKSQDRALKVDFVDTQLQRGGMISIGDQTVGQALSTICSRFHLRYRVDSDGTIILDSADTTADILPSKTYWLKPGALPPNASAQETLAAKGITFGKGASAEWHADTGLLSMTNTDENQAKLVALIASDLGGTLGSPTHWLTLTSGGRLGLAVDSFGADFITGHHPLYGAVKIPVNEVVGIRTTAPDPTPAVRMLDGWRLVDAPEPVIPAPGSDDATALGKDAADFKLPLLDNGEFDLAAEKGNIIVLDFWATWCGPCVRSLPGLVDAVSSFSASRVKLIGVNQGEAPDVVKHFLAMKNLKLAVALDADQGVARKYGVDAIPHTVIVGPDGKIAWVQTGYEPGNDAAVSDAIKRLLNPSATKPPAPVEPQ